MYIYCSVYINIVQRQDKNNSIDKIEIKETIYRATKWKKTNHKTFYILWTVIKHIGALALYSCYFFDIGRNARQFPAEYQAL